MRKLNSKRFLCVHKSGLCWFEFIGCGFLLALLFAASAQGQEANPILSPISEAGFSKLRDPLTFERIEKISTNSRLISKVFTKLNWTRLDLWESKSFVIPVEDDIKIDVMTKKKYWDDNGKLHLYGRIWNDSYGKVHIVMSKDGIAATILAGGRSYEIVALGESVHAIYSYQESQKQSALHAEDTERKRIEADEKISRQSDVSIQATSDNFIDVMVVYTDDVAASNLNPEGTIQAHVDFSNQALADSCANYRFRLVHTEQVTYAETGSANADLDCITNVDGCLDNIHTLRDTHGADLVQLVTQTSDYCGLAWAPTSSPSAGLGFSIKLFACDGSTMAHEIGHNMTLSHDRFQQSLQLRESGSYGNGYGYIDLVNKTRTIMSYADQCTNSGFNCSRIGIFSNPKVKLNGINQGELNFVDSIGKLNSKYSTVANFKSSVTSYSPSIDPNCVASSEENKDVHCFIASATYGSYLHPDVLRLRDFRDNILSESNIGRQLIELYYTYSPRMAFFISDKPFLKKVSRWLLYPVVLAVKYPLILAAIIPLFCFLFWMAIQFFLLKRTRLVSTLALIFLATIFSDPTVASIVNNSIFIDQISANPASMSAQATKPYIGVSQNSLSGEGGSTETSTEVKGAPNSIHLGYLGASTSLKLKIDPSSSTQIKRDAQLLGLTTDDQLTSSTQANLAHQMFEKTRVGIKYYSKSDDIEFESSSLNVKTELTKIGLGASMPVSERVGLAAGMDYVTETGSNIPDTKSIDLYLGVGLKGGESGKSWQAEVGLLRKPEILQSDGTLTNVHGETQIISFRAQTLLGLEMLSGPLLLGFDYESQTEKSVSQFISDDLLTDLMSISLGTIWGEDTLHTVLRYTTKSESFGEDRKDTLVAFSLIYQFGPIGQ